MRDESDTLRSVREALEQVHERLGVIIARMRPREEARYPMGHRMREIVEAPDGSLYALEDGSGGRLLHLTPQ